MHFSSPAVMIFWLLQVEETREVSSNILASCPFLLWGRTVWKSDSQKAVVLVLKKLWNDLSSEARHRIKILWLFIFWRKKNHKFLRPCTAPFFLSLKHLFISSDFHRSLKKKDSTFKKSKFLIANVTCKASRLFFPRSCTGLKIRGFCFND